MPRVTPSNDNDLLGVSLFTGAGIGDLGFRKAGVEFIATCELEHDRAALSARNFPNAKHFVADIQAAGPEIVAFVRAELKRRKQDLFLITCTAPCQGMSKNGQGTLLRNIREGKRLAMDPRNRLILPALAIVRELKPQFVVFENVQEMRRTLIEDDSGQVRPILEVVEDALAPQYSGEAYDIEVADYGVPQRRQRLITVYTRVPSVRRLHAAGESLVPGPTHSKTGGRGRKKWVSVEAALRAFPPLDAGSAKTATSSIPFHRVPVLDPKKYEWVRHTPLGRSAFDNQCVNPKCLCDENPGHGNTRGQDGINRANKGTPLYCEKCGDLLPRPYTEESDGSRRIMSGYTSAYKRMDASLPAPTLTRNMSYPCSDQKVHPFEHRVLSLAEAMRLHSIDGYDYAWEVDGKAAPDSLIRLVIGESVPPRFLELLGRHLLSMARGNSQVEPLSAPVQRRLAL